MNTKKLTLVSILASVIIISGMFKIPSPLTGSEFQMSAPIAVIIAMVFGFEIYITAGIVASVISLMAGLTTLPGVIIAMVFRIVVGIVIYILGENKLSLTISGPIGTFCGRIVLGTLFAFDIKVLLMVAFPGMIFTAITSLLIYERIYKIVLLSPYKEFIYYKREKSYEV